MITKFKIFEKYEDVDPYGEENWEDDEIIGSTAIILPKIKEYIGRKGWPRSFVELIGKEFKINDIKYIDGYDCYILSGYIIPRDCVEIIKPLHH